MYNLSDVASRIKSTAKMNNIKIKDMLFMCNLNINTISTLARGKSISAESLARIADYLNVSMDYLMGRTDSPYMVQLVQPGDNTDQCGK